MGLSFATEVPPNTAKVSGRSRRRVGRHRYGQFPMIDLPFVATRVFGTPLMIARAKLEVILGALAPRLSGAVAQAIQIDPAPEPGASITAGGIAVVPVIGTLVTRSSYLSAASGLSSYGAIGDAVTSAFEDPAVRGIILEIEARREARSADCSTWFKVSPHSRPRLTNRSGRWRARARCPPPTRSRAPPTVFTSLKPARSARSASLRLMSTRAVPTRKRASPGLFAFAGDHKIDGNAHQPLSDQARGAI